MVTAWGLPHLPRTEEEHRAYLREEHGEDDQADPVNDPGELEGAGNCNKHKAQAHVSSEDVDVSGGSGLAGVRPEPSWCLRGGGGVGARPCFPLPFPPPARPPLGVPAQPCRLKGLCPPRSFGKQGPLSVQMSCRDAPPSAPDATRVGNEAPHLDFSL